MECIMVNIVLPAFSFIQCKKYLNENNIDINGNKLNLIN